ncbi:MAG: hypothetical protein EXR07_14220 [Acetobacteraceae bacterium]|nr:hypothetical protein [Acetobacteraceae bacterium]
MLQFGRYKEGWELFEWRFYGTGAAVGARVFRQPPWDGQGFHGQMLLVHAEQGLGDTIQSYRFVPMARQLGGVTVEVPRPLARLFASQPNAPLVVPRGDPPPRFDLQCPMMTLPLVLGIELHSLPGAPYLVADPALGAAWRAKLPPLGDQMRVGIAWAGNPEHPNDRNRSVSLSVMLDMAGTGAMVVSLQQTVPDADQQTLREASHVIDPRAGLTDFAETAALIDQLDLVIAVDTSVAHLAGAMGKPVWILLPANADWRWLLERDDSPWYPSARLFRQDKPGDWAGVAARVRDALKEWPRRA